MGNVKSDLGSPSKEAVGEKPARRLLPEWALSNRTAAVAMAVAAGVAFFTTWFLMSPLVKHVDRDTLTAIFVGDVLIAASFAVLIGMRLWHALAERRHQAAGSRTHLQLVGLFSLLAVIPAVIAFVFAFTIMRTSLDDVFSERINNYQNTARELANSMWLNEQNAARLNLDQMVLDLETWSEFGVTASTPINFRRFLMQQALARDLAAIYVLDGNRNIMARVERMDAGFALPPKADFDKIDQAATDNAAPRAFFFDANDEARFDFYRGTLKISDYDGGYIITYKEIPANIATVLPKVQTDRDDWAEATGIRERLERVFFAGYVLLAVIILFGAIWAAIWAATRLVRPVGRLINMAERVSSGELGARVDVLKEDGELGVLSQAMNRMTAQLQTQRDDLISTNRQVDERRRFTEAVLSGVSAGVIGFAAGGRITIANKSAAELLGEEASHLPGRWIQDVMPELRGLIARSANGDDVEVGDQIELERDGAARNLNVRIVKDRFNGEDRFVATFDEITDLIAAQRSAAWGDVARRIAHEIKNPLTPIQLSAERLRRKYLNEVTTTPEVFDKCTDTIIRQVSDIGRMVDEFSSFARMPKPVIACEDLRELARAAVFPQKVAFPDIEFDIVAADEPSVVNCDGRLIVQALSNLLKNAGESISTRTAEPGAGYPGRVRIEIVNAERNARVSIIDNGLGLPAQERHRLTEPYMTTRAKGTGLGLAIVKKVAEEHGGSLIFCDDTSLGETGARMTLTLPRATRGQIDGSIATAAE